jgi:hypothetical protein
MDSSTFELCLSGVEYLGPNSRDLTDYSVNYTVN